ncbi:MAG: HD domain-containing protein [Patescibacteria group bacterium]
MSDHLAAEIAETSNGVEISPYLWRIVTSGQVYEKLNKLLDNGETAAANGEFETSYKHSIDVAKLAESYADSTELLEPEKEIFITAALLHDIGKDEVPLEILTKDKPLSPEERQQIQTHAVSSWQDCKEIADSFADDDEKRKMFLMISEIVLRHHRPGSGESYPDDEFLKHHLDNDPKAAVFLEAGNRPATIEEMSNQLSVIDIFESLRSHRAYREPAEAGEVGKILQAKFPLVNYPKEQKLINFLISKLPK